MLVGLVTQSLFVATVTTSLVSKSLDTDYKLYGNKVAEHWNENNCPLWGPLTVLLRDIQRYQSCMWCNFHLNAKSNRSEIVLASISSVCDWSRKSRQSLNQLDVKLNSIVLYVHFFFLISRRDNFVTVCAALNARALILAIKFPGHTLNPCYLTFEFANFFCL